jgi:outer membrane biogenesis lipoprotein LolB
MKTNLLWQVIALVNALILMACTPLVPTIPKTSKAAQTAIDRLRLFNQGLMDYKGIGQMQLIHLNQSKSARMVWAGSFPDKLRMDIMGSPGVNLATLASDGEFVYLKLYQENRFYQKKNAKALFKGVVDIPISALEVIQILGGKIPLASHLSAVLKSDDNDFQTLELRDKWGNISQCIYWAQDQSDPVAFEMVKVDGTIVYRAEFIEWMDFKQFKVPKCLVLSNSKGDRFELTVERCWVNQPLPSSRFTLQP